MTTGAPSVKKQLAAVRMLFEGANAKATETTTHSGTFTFRNRAQRRHHRGSRRADTRGDIYKGPEKPGGRFSLGNAT